MSLLGLGFRQRECPEGVIGARVSSRLPVIGDRSTTSALTCSGCWTSTVTSLAMVALGTWAYAVAVADEVVPSSWVTVTVSLS